MNKNWGKEEEEEGQVFIASAKGQNGPKNPFTPENDSGQATHQELASAWRLSHSQNRKNQLTSNKQK